jgi:hypothetical protein
VEHENQQSTNGHHPNGEDSAGVGTVPESEILEVLFYPEDKDIDEVNEVEADVNSIIEAFEQHREAAAPTSAIPTGYVSNARNAGSGSDAFHLWSPAEDASLGIGSLVRHTANDPQTEKPTNTYAIVVEAEAQTLGLDDYAVHVYEQDARPPLDSIKPAPSRRRPVVNYKGKVISSDRKTQRPVLSGPVYAVKADELGAVHGKAPDAEWPGAAHILLGFYEDPDGEYGVFAEERARVLGPKQGHAILSGLPGAGKTSLFLTTSITLFSQLRKLSTQARNQDTSPTLLQEGKVPRVATVAINVKGADLLFVDHLDDSDLNDQDKKMWAAAGVDTSRRPFGRVRYFVPMSDDGVNSNSLRNNPLANAKGYSETHEFTLGIMDLWPYLNLFFEKRSTNVVNLLAEVAEHFRKTGQDRVTLANVLDLFEKDINRPKSERGDAWKDHHAGVVQAVYQRFKSLPATLGGLIDVTGTGYGLSGLTELEPLDMVVVDIERIMANPQDPQVADSAIKIITAYVLNRLTEAMTRGTARVDNVVVFADELNRLAPRGGSDSGGIGENLAQIARTTRDRGIVLFGAGQFRSGINEDLLKAASVHFSTQTPEYELGDRLYSSLSPEIKARLTQLRPGETLLQYPSLRTAVFATFPRPFVLAGATKWREQFPQAAARPLYMCVTERLRRISPERAPREDDVRQMLDNLPLVGGESSQDAQQLIVSLLRQVEMDRALSTNTGRQSPWEQFSKLATEHLRQKKATKPSVDGVNLTMPSGFYDSEEIDDDE